jgi:hypothetical protein
MICSRCKHDVEESEMVPGTRWCSSCRTKARQRRELYGYQGRCKVCGRTPLVTKCACEACAIRAIETINLVRHGIINELMEKQEGACALSGIELVVGINLSIDHIKPVSSFEGATRRDKLRAASADSNLRLIDNRINCLLKTMSDIELLYIAERIVEYNNISIPCDA